MQFLRVLVPLKTTAWQSPLRRTKYVTLAVELLSPPYFKNTGHVPCALFVHTVNRASINSYVKQSADWVYSNLAVLERQEIRVNPTRKYTMYVTFASNC